MNKLKENIKYYFFSPFLQEKWEKILVLKNVARYKSLLAKNVELRKKHEGETCYLLGSGNSIRNHDISMLQNENLFFLNNFYVHKDFDLLSEGGGGKYYVTAPIHKPQTEDEWRKWVANIEGGTSSRMHYILGLSGADCNLKYLTDKYTLLNGRLINWYYAGPNQVGRNDISIDIEKPIVAAETVSIYALILALYMGFDKIYLLGMDHDYILYEDEKDMRMYSSAVHQKNELKRTFGENFYVEEYFRQYNIFSKYSILNDQFENTIFNASESGLLKVFPRVSLQSTLE